VIDAVEGRTRWRAVTCTPLLTTEQGLKLGVTDAPLFGNVGAAPIAAYGHEGTMVRVKVGANCLSLSSDAADRNGTDDVVRSPVPERTSSDQSESGLASPTSGSSAINTSLST
jgi:hypothetical protein